MLLGLVIAVTSALKLKSKVLLDVCFLTLEFACAHICAVMGGERKEEDNSPFNKIYSFMEDLGSRLGWELAENISTETSESLWQRVQYCSMTSSLSTRTRKLKLPYGMERDIAHSSSDTHVGSLLPDVENDEFGRLEQGKPDLAHTAPVIQIRLCHDRPVADHEERLGRRRAE